jgi:hypothetical protein
MKNRLVRAPTERSDISGEYVLCDWCGQDVLRREPHKALCGLPCTNGKLGLEDEVIHDQDCPRCI